MDYLLIADKKFSSRLFLGTGKFGSSKEMQEAVIASGSELVTVALRRIQLAKQEDDLLKHLKIKNVNLLPNTSGARNSEEAVFAAELAREALETNWIKLEIHPDPRYLLPDPIETFAAAQELVGKGFVVLPYVNADPVLCKRLEELGCAAVMPLAAPIGSNQGLKMLTMLEIIIEQSQVPVVVDAGLGAPSHALRALEIGADAVLVNTAIASAKDPILMAKCFKQAVEVGRATYLAGVGAENQRAKASSPLTAFLG